MSSAATKVFFESHPGFRSQDFDTPEWHRTSPKTNDLQRQSLDSGVGDMFLSRNDLRAGNADLLEDHVDGAPILEQNLRINSERLWGDINYTAQWGAIDGSFGMARLAASGEDKMVRDWFVCEARAIGCKIEIDHMGNIFAILPGLCSDMAPIAMGSHLDTQPAGKLAIQFSGSVQDQNGI